MIRCGVCVCVPDGRSESARFWEPECEREMQQRGERGLTKKEEVVYEERFDVRVGKSLE